MDKIALVVDTNIVFSSILNPASRIARVLVQHHQYFDFYSCGFLQTELDGYSERIGILSGKSSDDIQRIRQYVIKHITFIDDALIPASMVQRGYSYTREVDPNDTLFVALALWLEAPLWTGDKKLLNGLQSMGFPLGISTPDVFSIVIEREMGQK